MNAFSRTEPVPAPAPRFDAPLACALTALILLVAAFCLPFATAVKFGEAHDGYLVSGVASLWREGDWHLALLVLGCGFLAPLGLTGLLCLLLGGARLARPQPALRGCLRLAARLEQWSMPEVQMLGVIVAFTKLSTLVPTRPDAGLWCYGAGAFFTLLAWRGFDAASVAGVLFPAREPAR